MFPASRIRLLDPLRLAFHVHTKTRAASYFCITASGRWNAMYLTHNEGKLSGKLSGKLATPQRTLSSQASRRIESMYSCLLPHLHRLHCRLNYLILPIFPALKRRLSYTAFCSPPLFSLLTLFRRYRPIFLYNKALTLHHRSALLPLS